MARSPKNRLPVPDNKNKVMRFLDWCIFEKGITMRGLAKELKVTTATLYSWRRTCEVPLKHLKQIEDYTDGSFPPQYFKPDLIILKGSERAQ